MTAPAVAAAEVPVAAVVVTAPAVAVAAVPVAAVVATAPVVAVAAVEEENRLTALGIAILAPIAACANSDAILVLLGDSFMNQMYFEEPFQPGVLTNLLFPLFFQRFL